MSHSLFHEGPPPAARRAHSSAASAATIVTFVRLPAFIARRRAANSRSLSDAPPPSAAPPTPPRSNCGRLEWSLASPSQDTGLAAAAAVSSRRFLLVRLIGVAPFFCRPRRWLPGEAAGVAADLPPEAASALALRRDFGCGGDANSADAPTAPLAACWLPRRRAGVSASCLGFRFAGVGCGDAAAAGTDDRRLRFGGLPDLTGDGWPRSLSACAAACGSDATRVRRGWQKTSAHGKSSTSSSSKLRSAHNVCVYEVSFHSHVGAWRLHG